MSQNAITIRNLGKRYKLGSTFQHDTLRDHIAHAARRITGAFTKRGGPDTNKKNGPQELWALNDLNLEIKQGEILGIVGRNGAGKSTLLKVLSRITSPTTGELTVRGRVASLLEVGTGFHPELSGRENIYLNGSILGMTRAEIKSKFDEIVEFSEIEKFLDTPVKRYSSGMYVRLAFAVAASLESEILVVDEVLAVGDAAFQKKCLLKMEDVGKSQGRTVLFVSHNLLTLQNLCTRAIQLKEGKVTMDGDVDTVISDYLSTDGESSGEIHWTNPTDAPGDERVRLKSVRIVVDSETTGAPSISEDFEIEIDYWNFQANSERLVSIHLHTDTGIWLIASANSPSVSLTPDPWQQRKYEPGLYRTRCTIPGYLLNAGRHHVSVAIVGKTVQDIIFYEKQILSFSAEDSMEMRQEFTGAWPAIIRPRLDWDTEKLDSKLP